MNWSRKALLSNWRFSKSIRFVNTVLAFCYSFRECDAFTWFNYFLTKSLALNPARRGAGFVRPANPKPLPSHLIVLQKAPWKKITPFFRALGKQFDPGLLIKGGSGFYDFPYPCNRVKRLGMMVAFFFFNLSHYNISQLKAAKTVIWYLVVIFLYTFCCEAMRYGKK